MHKNILKVAAALVLIGTSLHAQSKIYVAEYKFNDPKLYRMNLDGTSVETLMVFPTADWLPLGLHFDATAGKLYWTHGSFNQGAIRRANLDGSGVETLLSGLTNPRGLDVDLAGGKLYWSDTQDRRMYRANLDGTGLEPIVDHGTQLGRPRLDLPNGKLYYGDFGTNEIRRCNLDGSSNELLFGAHVDQANHIALDHAGGKLYWVDQQTSFVTNYVARANFDGTGFEELYTGLPTSSGLVEIDLDLAAGKIYWADEITDAEKGVWCANLDGSNPVRIYASPTGWNAGAFHLELSTLGGSGSSDCDCSSGASPCFTASAAGRGCPNSNSNGLGAKLIGAGSAVIAADTFSLSVTDAAPNKAGLILAGTASLGPNGVATLPDSAGLFCVGGSTRRGSVVVTDANGAANFPDFNGAPYGASGIVSTGTSISYTHWFRDPGTAAGCAGDTPSSDFNFSNGWTVVWQ